MLKCTHGQSIAPFARNGWCLKLALTQVSPWLLGLLWRRDHPEYSNALLANLHALYQCGFEGMPGWAEKSPCSSGSHLFTALGRNVLDVRFDLRHWQIVPPDASFWHLVPATHQIRPPPLVLPLGVADENRP